MRIFLQFPVVLLMAYAALSATATAQVQERKLMERIQNPDRTLTSPMQGKSFGISSAHDAGGFDGGSKGYLAKDSTAVKEYSGTRSFFGIKNPWFGNKIFPADAAPIASSGNSSLAARVFPVANATVTESALASKKMNGSDRVVSTREYAGKGGAQGGLDQITDKVHREMTIDDVRELLNNPR